MPSDAAPLSATRRLHPWSVLFLLAGQLRQFAVPVIIALVLLPVFAIPGVEGRLPAAGLFRRKDRFHAETREQWRRWLGADGKVHDQIAGVIHSLKHNPSSRRILFHGWNVSEIEGMALPPCHLLYQYHVSSQGRLSCILYQRSADILLGVPFNWTGAVALQLMLAQQAGLTPGDFVWMGADVHLYKNHVEQAREQLSRDPRPLPSMRLAGQRDSIDDYRVEDFVVEGYDPHPPIKADVAV